MAPRSLRSLATDPTTIRFAEIVVAALSIAAIAIYLRAVAGTILSPYPIEGMEGGTIDVVSRILHGLPVYVPPSIEYVPYRYAPFYYWVSAAATAVFGGEFAAPRLVSLASIAGVALFIWAFVRHEGGKRVDALAAMGLFAATYFKTLRFFHLARIDSLFLFLLIAGLFVLRAGTRARSAVAAGVLLWLSIETKQVGLLTLGIALPIAALGAPRRVLQAGACCAALVVVTNLVMDWRTDGWWSYYLFLLPLWHLPYRPAYWGYWRYDLLRAMPVALLAGGLFVARTARGDMRRATFYGGLLAGTIAASWSARVAGGAGNALMPVFAVLVIVLPLGAAQLRSGRGVALVMIAIQFAIVMQPIPSESDPSAYSDAAIRESGDRLVAFLKTVPGEVLIWDLRFVQTRAGKTSLGLETAAEDVMASTDIGRGDRLQNDVIQACRSGRFAGAIDPPAWLARTVLFGPSRELPGIHVLPGTEKGAAFSRYYPLNAAAH